MYLNNSLPNDQEKQKFETRIGDLLPEYDRAAMKVWHQYAEEIDAAENMPLAKFYEALYVEFSLVAEQYGTALTTELFSIANISFCLNPFEVRGASHHLHDGKTLEDIARLAVDGLCDTTKEEDEQTRAALAALREESTPSRPSVREQLREARNKPHPPCATAKDREAEPPKKQAKCRDPELL